MKIEEEYEDEESRFSSEGDKFEIGDGQIRDHGEVVKEID